MVETHHGDTRKHSKVCLSIENTNTFV